MAGGEDFSAFGFAGAGVEGESSAFLFSFFAPAPPKALKKSTWARLPWAVFVAVVGVGVEVEIDGAAETAFFPNMDFLSSAGAAAATFLGTAGAAVAAGGGATRSPVRRWIVW